MSTTIESKLADALRTIITGSEVTGRWLDSRGHECSEEDEDAEWHEYDEEEQASWRSSCVAIAKSALEGYEEAAAKQAALLQQARDALEIGMLAIDSDENPETADQLTAAYEAMVAGVPSWQPTVHVFVEDGHVTSIVSDVEGLRTACVSYDYDSADEDEGLHQIPQANGSTADAKGHRGLANYSPELIEKVEAALCNAPCYRSQTQDAQPER